MEKINKENKNKVVNYICPIFWFVTQTFNWGYKAAQLRLVVAASQLALSFALPSPHPPTEGCPIEFFFLSEPLKIASEKSKSC